MALVVRPESVIRLLIFLLAASAASAQVPDGQALVRAALGDEYTVYDVLPTGSMRPAFDETYWLLVRILPWSDIQLGDTILYESKRPFYADGRLSPLICHSVTIVIRRSSGGSVLIVKGLANPAPDDEPVTKDMYRGTVVGTVKKPRAPRTDSP